jgi:hypothetical protein
MRRLRSKIDSQDVLYVGTTILSITKDVADVASCGPLKGAATLLLTILDNVKVC